jgi:hypothetical protein
MAARSAPAGPTKPGKGISFKGISFASVSSAPAARAVDREAFLHTPRHQSAPRLLDCARPIAIHHVNPVLPRTAGFKVLQPAAES